MRFWQLQAVGRSVRLHALLAGNDFGSSGSGIPQPALPLSRLCDAHAHAGARGIPESLSGMASKAFGRELSAQPEYDVDEVGPYAARAARMRAIFSFFTDSNGLRELWRLVAHLVVSADRSRRGGGRSSFAACAAMAPPTPTLGELLGTADGLLTGAAAAAAAAVAEGGESVNHREEVVRAQRAVATQLESTRMLRRGSSARHAVGGSLAALVTPGLEAPGAETLPSRDERTLMDAAERFLRIGDARAYCEIMLSMDMWYRALAIAPAVSLEYWRKLTRRFANLLAAEESEQAVPLLIACGSVDEAVEFYVRRHELPSAFLVAQAHSEKRLPQKSPTVTVPKTVQGVLPPLEQKTGIVPSDEGVVKTNGDSRGLAGSPGGGNEDDGRVNRVAELMAAEFFERGLGVLSACCHLAVGAPAKAVHTLLRCCEVELAYGVAACVADCPAEHVTLALAVHCERLGEFELAVRLLKRTDNPGPHLQALCARARLGIGTRNAGQGRSGSDTSTPDCESNGGAVVGESKGGERGKSKPIAGADGSGATARSGTGTKDLYELAGLPSPQSFAEEGAANERRGDIPGAIRCLVVAATEQSQRRAVELGLDILRKAFRTGSGGLEQGEYVDGDGWDLDAAAATLDVLQSVDARALPESARDELLVWCSVLGAHRAMWWDYPPLIMSSLMRTALGLMERDSLADARRAGIFAPLFVPALAVIEGRFLLRAPGLRSGSPDANRARAVVNSALGRLDNGESTETKSSEGGDRPGEGGGSSYSNALRRALNLIVTKLDECDRDAAESKSAGILDERAVPSLDTSGNTSSNTVVASSSLFPSAHTGKGKRSIFTNDLIRGPFRHS